MRRRHPEAPLSPSDADALERDTVSVLRALGLLPAVEGGLPDRRARDPEQEITQPGVMIRSRS